MMTRAQALSLFLSLFLSIGLFAQGEQPAVVLRLKDGSMGLDKKEHNFGKIPQGTPVECSFKVTNMSEAPLILTSVKGTCGCTVTDYDKAPIPPGGHTFVKATYNAKALGSFRKGITVHTNLGGDAPNLLMVSGEVVKE